MPIVERATTRDGSRAGPGGICARTAERHWKWGDTNCYTSTFVSLKLAFKVAVAVEENAEVLHRASGAGVPNVLVYADIDIPVGARLP